MDGNTLEKEMAHLVKEMSLLLEELTSTCNEEKNLKIKPQEETTQNKRIDVALINFHQVLT